LPENHISSGSKTAILLINLGTPDSYKTLDVRRYLTQFLNDERVIDINAFARFMLVNFIIVPFRGSKSAKLYHEIWTDEGSPLLYHSTQLTEKLNRLMGDEYKVVLAMRYGNPSIHSALAELKKQNLKKIIIVPMYPQYSSSTTGSSVEEVLKHLSKWLTMPDIQIINSFYNHPAFLNCWYKIAARYHANNYDHILFSFHGLPERQIIKSDECNYCLKTETCCDTINQNNHQCYRASCFETARKIANNMLLQSDKYTISFQSRLGNAPWIKPYSSDVIIQLAKQGKKNILVFSPAFVADCLETISEIGIEYNELFVEHGGQKITLVESLNSEDFWAEALKHIILT